MSRWHPWRALGRLSHVIVEWTDDLPPDVLGDTDGVTHIRIATGQLQTERRCTITHELVHVEQGHIGCCDQRAEGQVRREAARRLITIAALSEAAVFHGDDLEGLADDLWVDLDTLLTRLNHLHPSERGYLRRRIERRELGA